jgi:FAD:protein FMN transferase
MHRDWHAWEPGALTRVNAAFAAGEPVAADAAIVEMVRRSQQLEELSGGRFNPAIGGLIRLWGFHTSDYPILGPPPAAEAIERLVAQRPSSRDIRIDGLTLTSVNPAVQLDFGGIAKGYAIDLACARLRELGIRNAIVNAGGDLRAIGDHGDRPWRVAIRNPGGGIVGSLETGRGRGGFHVGQLRALPPAGRPALSAHSRPAQRLAGHRPGLGDRDRRRGLLADAAATALIVAGPDEWTEVARAMGLDQVLLVDAEGRVFLTPAMQQRVSLVEGIESVVVEIGP